jgi:hypothetical protein
MASSGSSSFGLPEYGVIRIHGRSGALLPPWVVERRCFFTTRFRLRPAERRHRTFLVRWKVAVCAINRWSVGVMELWSYGIVGSRGSTQPILHYSNTPSPLGRRSLAVSRKAGQFPHLASAGGFVKIPAFDRSLPWHLGGFRTPGRAWVLASAKAGGSGMYSRRPTYRAFL